MEDISTTLPPPPYTPKPQPTIPTMPFFAQDSGYNSETDDCSDSEDSLCSPQPTTITVDASTTLTGTGNVLACDNATTLRLAGSIAHALSKNFSDQRTIPSLNVRIDCGVKIVGARNVMARMQPRVPIRPAVQAKAAGGQNVSPQVATPLRPGVNAQDAAAAAAARTLVQLAGAKRRAEATEREECDERGEDGDSWSASKRCKVEG